MYKMYKTIFIVVLCVLVPFSYSQEPDPRPSFPDVFQTEIEATFKKEKGVVEIDASFFYDREKNRAALFMTQENQETRQVYNFDNDESISIDGNNCDVQEIPDEQGFFPFTVVDGKKKLSEAEKAFFFTNSKLNKESSTDGGVPTLMYIAKVDIPQYGRKNCDVIHVFSKPSFELATCREGWFCNSTLISLSVQCKNEKGELDVDHVYRFSRFMAEIKDESVFLPPPGIYCEMKNTLPLPPFSPYFSFTYGIIEKPMDTQEDSNVFKTHKEIWYDADYKILRIDEFNYDALHFSSRIFDLNAGVAFTIVGSHPTCDIGLIPSDFQLDVITRLPKAFFNRNNSTAKKAVHVGKRKVHGLNYEVWSFMWKDSDSAAKIVEEMYFLQTSSNNAITPSKDAKESKFQISHIDMYTYNMNEDTQGYKLVLLKHFSINNYQTKPKDWSAFDVSSCFSNKQKKDFTLKIQKIPLVKGSQSYREVLELLYMKLIAATGVSVVRISELRGIFDGVQLLEIKGSILDNSKSSGWPTESKEPGMQETFRRIRNAVSHGELTVSFKGEDNKENKIEVLSVEPGEDSPDPYLKPSFPDVFQTEIEGTFTKDNGVVEIDASFYYDRVKNRAALFMTKENELTRQAYNFDSDESITIDGNNCDVQKIPNEQGFFPFTIVNGKKKLSAAENAFFFTNSELNRQSLTEDGIPILVYHAKVDIPQYGKTNCDVTHVFSKPNFELSTCTEGLLCNSTLISLSVQCKNEKGEPDVDHIYRFSRFISNIEDDSVFLPPPGIYCEIKDTLPMPPFSPYFTFTYDIIEKTMDTQRDPTVFKMHKIWYDADYKVLRIDEFGYNALNISSRIFDLNAGAVFTISGRQSTCDTGIATNDMDVTTNLPKSFFARNNTRTEKAVHVGKRTLHGLDYLVWSVMAASESAARIVEEFYFLKTAPNDDGSTSKEAKESNTQLSHVDMYTYKMDDNTEEYKLVLMKHFSINNYHTKPKEWSAFDISSCFSKNQKKEFALKIKKIPLAKGSQSYRKILDLVYMKLIAAAGVSAVRINELKGIFDDMQLQEVRGSIIDNSKSSGWPTESKEPGMEEAFKRIAKAASDDKLSVTFKDDNKKELTIKVISVEAVKDYKASEESCFSGASMAAATLVLFLIGIAFGIIGYYVFLKKRRLSNATIRMTELSS